MPSVGKAAAALLVAFCLAAQTRVELDEATRAGIVWSNRAPGGQRVEPDQVRGIPALVFRIVGPTVRISGDRSCIIRPSGAGLFVVAIARGAVTVYPISTAVVSLDGECVAGALDPPDGVHGWRLPEGVQQYLAIGSVGVTAADSPIALVLTGWPWTCNFGATAAGIVAAGPC